MIRLAKNSGQGLLELIIAIGVIVVGLFSVWALFLANYSGERGAQEKILAANLAREGIELVKNMRDTNWLKIDANETCGSADVLCPWDDGLLVDGDSTAIVKSDFATGALTLDFSPADINSEATRLFVDSAGFYVHGVTDSSHSLSPTIYRRLITLRNICCSDTTPDGGDGQCDDNNFSVLADDSSCPTGEIKIGLEVESLVRWSTNNETKDIRVIDQLYNWH